MSVAAPRRRLQVRHLADEFVRLVRQLIPENDTILPGPP
jgi:hypothetical protein